ncbi:MAG: metal ABC transporter permease [Bacteroidota bacterium]
MGGWIILIASLAAINCSLVGTYLVLRKVAMMADAITHAVLPGIVLAFLFTGSRSSWVMLLGAGTTGIVATLLMAFLHKRARLQADAAIGITFTWMFALGIILISLFSRKVDLDPDCVLYGEVVYAPLNIWQTASGVCLGPWPAYLLALMLLINLGFILLSYKELAITTFDPAFATTLGMHTTLWHYLLMAVTSFTAVASFEVVGTVLVVALFVVPASTAYLLVQRLSAMLVVAAILGIGTAVSGYYLAVWLDGSIAGAMVTVAGIIFLTVFVVKTILQQVPWSSYYLSVYYLACLSADLLTL